MWYTLAKGYVWVLLGVVLGLVIGWLLRSVAARRQVARARAHHVDGAELQRMRSRVADLEAELDRTRAAGVRTDAALSSASPATRVADDDPLHQAEAVLGHPVRIDDLTVVAGITPDVAELCGRIGVRTWSDLAAVEPSLLRTMLVDAGAPFDQLDPADWPAEAGLLAAGRWSDVAARRDGLSDGGR